MLQTLHVLLHHGGLVPGYADRHTVLACYLAAILHDMEHLGRTNDFLISTHDDLAVRARGRPTWLFSQEHEHEQTGIPVCSAFLHHDSSGGGGRAHANGPPTVAACVRPQVRYNDRSPMENHHLAAGFSLLKQQEFNFLKNVPKPAWDALRRTVIELVLATE